MTDERKFPDYEAIIEYHETPEGELEGGLRGYFGQHDHPMHQPKPGGHTVAKFQIGDKARDRITRIEGIITARYEFATGPERFEIEYADSTGRHASSSFDDERLQLIETAAARERDAAGHELRITQPTPADGGEAERAQEQREEPDATPVSVDAATLEVTAEEPTVAGVEEPEELEE